MTATMPIPPTNGGLPAGLSSDRVTRGTIARWSANGGWVDRDGLPLPTPMLVIGYTTVLRRWKDKRPEYITEQPLPNPDELNAAIPVAEWEIGLDGDRFRHTADRAARGQRQHQQISREVRLGSNQRCVAG